MRGPGGVLPGPRGGEESLRINLRGAASGALAAPRPEDGAHDCEVQPGRRRARGALRRAGQAAGWAAYLLVAAAFVVVIAWLVAPRLLGWQAQVVLSGSMEPALGTGSVAFVEPKPATEVKVGDILTFRHPEHPELLVSHRVVEVIDGQPAPSFRTKGDANDGPDSWVVSGDTVIGIVRLDLPYVGYVTQEVRRPLGFALLVGLPAALIIAGEVLKLWKAWRKASEA